MDVTHNQIRDANAMTDDFRMPSTPELLRVHEEIEAIKRDSAGLVCALTDEALTWRLAADKWSIADCLAHLNITNRDYYIKTIRDTITDARARGVVGAEPYRHGFFGNLFVRMIEPPARFRVPAPRTLLPPADANPREVVAEFMSSQNELQRLLRDADGIDLGRAKVVSPVNKRLKFTLGQSFRMLAAHERRHLWQARNVKQAANFPR
jgi:hypothetical protein